MFEIDVIVDDSPVTIEFTPFEYEDGYTINVKSVVEYDENGERVCLDIYNNPYFLDKCESIAAEYYSEWLDDLYDENEDDYE